MPGSNCERCWANPRTADSRFGQDVRWAWVIQAMASLRVMTVACVASMNATNSPSQRSSLL